MKKSSLVFSLSSLAVFALSGCGGAGGGSSSSMSKNYVKPYFENLYVRPSTEDIETSPIKLRAYTKEEGEVAPFLFSDYDTDVIEINDGYIRGKKRGVSKLTITSDKYVSTITVYSQPFFRGFDDENWEYRRDNYIDTFGSPKGYACFLGDSFFDERGYYKNFYKDYEGKKAYVGGLGGATTHDMRELLDQWTLGFTPSSIILNISCNNIDNISESGEQAFHNLQFLLEDIHEKKPDMKIFVESITPSFPCIGNWPEAQTSNALCKAYIEKHSDYLTYLPLGEAFAEHMNEVKNEDGTTTPSYLGNDGMHPSLTGYKAIEDMLLPYSIIEDK